MFVDGMRYTWPAKAKIVGIVVAFLFVLGYHLTRLIGGYGLHLGNEFRKAMSGEANPRKEENLVARSWAAALDWKDKHWPERVPKPIDWKVASAVLLTLALLACIYGYGVSNAGNWNWLWDGFIVPPAGGVDWTDIVFGGTILLIVVASVVAIVCAFAFGVVYLAVALWELLVRFWRWLRRLNWKFIIPVALILLVFALVVTALYALVDVFVYTTTHGPWSLSLPKLRPHPDWNVLNIGGVSLPWLYAIGAGIIAIVLGYFNRARIARMFRRINIASAIYILVLASIGVVVWNNIPHAPHVPFVSTHLIPWGKGWAWVVAHWDIVGWSLIGLAVAVVTALIIRYRPSRRTIAWLAAVLALVLLLGSLAGLVHNHFSTSQAGKQQSQSIGKPKSHGNVGTGKPKSSLARSFGWKVGAGYDDNGPAASIAFPFNYGGHTKQVTVTVHSTPAGAKCVGTPGNTEAGGIPCIIQVRGNVPSNAVHPENGWFAGNRTLVLMLDSQSGGGTLVIWFANDSGQAEAQFSYMPDHSTKACNLNVPSARFAPSGPEVSGSGSETDAFSGGFGLNGQVYLSVSSYELWAYASVNAQPGQIQTKLSTEDPTVCPIS